MSTTPITSERLAEIKREQNARLEQAKRESRAKAMQALRPRVDFTRSA